jgi:hypothetical protein
MVSRGAPGDVRDGGEDARMNAAPDEIVAGGGGEFERLAYQLSLRDLDRQEGVLDELRSRAGTILTASSILASFLGGQAISHSGFGWWTWATLAAFIASVTACVWILLPVSALRFGVGGPGAYEALYYQGDNMPEVHRRLAYWLADFYDGNQRKIDALVVRYRIAAAAVVIEGILWAIDFRIG